MLNLVSAVSRDMRLMDGIRRVCMRSQRRTWRRGVVRVKRICEKVMNYRDEFSSNMQYEKNIHIANCPYPPWPSFIPSSFSSLLAWESERFDVHCVRFSDR